MAFFNHLQEQSQRFIIIIGIALIILIGGVDYITGSEISVSVFYLIPIAMIAWLTNKMYMGVSAAIFAAVVWLIVDVAGDRVYSSDVIPVWNASVRLSFFLIVVFALSFLRDARHRQEELAHFIVHDLRSPLSNALTGLSYLLDISGDALDAAQQQLVKLSIASCTRMMTLVNSLLDLAKLESGQLKPAVIPVDVQQLFDTTLQQISAMAMRAEVNLTSQIDEGAGHVVADNDLVLRVLVNLVSNALKYSPQESTVLLHAVLRPDKSVAISVTDQGAGIPEKWLNKIFDKFAQVEARKSGMAVGSGLGLTFCKLAIEAQGGHIWAESALNQGTTITFTLPPDALQN